MSRPTIPFVAVLLLAVACSPTPPPRVHPPLAPSPPSFRGPMVREPLEVAPPAVDPTDTPLVRATKLGWYMEARWPRIDVYPDADAAGRTAAFRVKATYDPYRGDDRAWAEGVRRVAGDVRQASVELLKLAARYFPDLRWASVWEDRVLIFFWSREQIEEMGDPASYRDHESFQALRRLAAVQPPLLQQARKEASERAGSREGEAPSPV